MDLNAMALHAVAVRSAWAPLLGFAAGAATSIGPCVAPRFVAVAGLTIDRNSREICSVVAAFVGGLAATYALAGVAASVFWQAFRHSEEIYGILAASMAVAAVILLLKPQQKCVHGLPVKQMSSLGSIFLLGASCAVVFSPCCAPLVFAIIGYASSTGNPLFASGVLICFALGHALPIVFVAAGAGSLSRIATNTAWREATNLVSASLLLALACFYVVVA